MPCRTHLANSRRSFKFGVVVHGVTMSQSGGPGVFENQWPSVGITVGERTKETEHGDWSPDANRWCFNETIMVVATMSDEISVFVSCSTKYNLYVASVSWISQRIGEVCLPVSQLMGRLKLEDRDSDGLIYTTPVLNFDVVQEGRCTGRVYLSFETRTAPPVQRLVDPDRLCGCGVEGMDGHHLDDDIMVAASLDLAETPRYGGSRIPLPQTPPRIHTAR